MTSNDELDGRNEGIRTASNIRQDMKPLSQVLIPRHSQCEAEVWFSVGLFLVAYRPYTQWPVKTLNSTGIRTLLYAAGDTVPCVMMASV